MGLTLSIDPAGTELVLHDPVNGWRLTEFDAPAPDLDSQWASSADTEGERRAGWRYTNRTITATVKITKSSDALLEAAENLLEAAIGRLQRDGGELELGYPSGETITFDVLEANLRRVYTPSHLAARMAEYELTFACLPLGRGTAVTLSDHVETTLPCLTWQETAITGTAPALGRLLVDNDVATAQQTLRLGMRSKYASTAATAALFYQAESFTADAAATAVGTAGASGGGSNVRKNTALTTSMVRQFRSPAANEASPFTHIGDYRVFVRVLCPATNTGIVQVRLRWQGAGQVTLTTNASVTYESAWEGGWRLLDLGMVSLPEVLRGSQVWVGMVDATSSAAGDDIEFDAVFLFPAERWGLVSGLGSDPAMYPSGSTEIRYDGVLINVTTTDVWVGVPKYEGDYLLIPPGTADFIVKASRGLATEADSAIDDISARLTITPRYLVVPAA